MDIRSALSTEFVRVPVSAYEDGALINPTTNTVQMAVVPTGTTPVSGDWKAAVWETDTTIDPDVYYARVLIGPAPGVVTLVAGNVYDVYVKVFDNPETPIRMSGHLGIL